MMFQSSMSNAKKAALSIVALLLIAGGAAFLLWKQPASHTAQTNPATQSQNVEASLVVDGVTYTAEVPQGSSLLAFMEKVQAETDFSFAGETSEGIGFFVNEVNGVKSSTEENKFWLYYINGQPATSGVQDYTVNHGDTIEWKHESF